MLCVILADIKPKMKKKVTIRNLFRYSELHVSPHSSDEKFSLRIVATHKTLTNGMNYVRL